MTLKYRAIMNKNSYSFSKYSFSAALTDPQFSVIQPFLELGKQAQHQTSHTSCKQWMSVYIVKITSTTILHSASSYHNTTPYSYHMLVYTLLHTGLLTQ